jgi:hypothetical protein
MEVHHSDRFCKKVSRIKNKSVIKNKSAFTKSFVDFQNWSFLKVKNGIFKSGVPKVFSIFKMGEEN